MQCKQEMLPYKKNNVTYPKCKRVYKLPGRGAVTDLPTKQLCTLHSAVAERQKILVIIESHKLILASTFSNNLKFISQFLVFDL